MKVKERTVAMLTSRCRKAGCVRAGDHSRGLCEACYRGTHKYVADGVVSWQKLERQGKVAPLKTSLKDWLLS